MLSGTVLLFAIVLILIFICSCCAVMCHDDAITEDKKVPSVTKPSAYYDLGEGIDWVWQIPPI